MKAKDAAGQLDSRAMNDVVLDFMSMSMIDVSKEIYLLRDRVTVLEEIAARLETRHPEGEVRPESSIAGAKLPPEASKTDGTLAGEVITALGIGLAHVSMGGCRGWAPLRTRTAQTATQANSLLTSTPQETKSIVSAGELMKTLKTLIVSRT